DEQGVVPGYVSSKKAAHSAPEIIFTLFRFHYGISSHSYANNHRHYHHVAVAGFWNAPFEGGKKSGVPSARSLNFRGLDRPTYLIGVKRMWRSDLRARDVAPVVWRYGLAVLCVALSTAATFPVQNFGVRTSLFFPAILLATWFGGTGPGLLAVLLSTLSINFFFTEPVYAFQFSARDIPTTVAFLFS